MTSIAKVDYATGEHPSSVLMAEIDNDGRPELLVSNESSSGISVLRNRVGEGQVVPSGNNPVTGVVSNKVAVDESVQSFNGAPYVQRHYDIEPKSQVAANATATLTLYFSQPEFNNFNNYPGVTKKLPSAPIDAVDVSSLRVYQHHGTSASGLPGSYSGSVEVINPPDDSIIWNPKLQMWEVSFDIKGLSGFFVASETETVLPLKLGNLSAEKSGTDAWITWTSANEIGPEHFEIQKSSNGISFEKIATVKALNAGNAESRYKVADKAPLEAVCYYRLKIFEKDRCLIPGHLYGNLVLRIIFLLR